MGKRFSVSGKNTFVDNHEKIAFVSLNDGSMISVELNPDTLANIAWHQSSLEHRLSYLKRFYQNPTHYIDMQYFELPDQVKQHMREYQAQKLEDVKQ